MSSGARLVRSIALGFSMPHHAWPHTPRREIVFFNQRGPRPFLIDDILSAYLSPDRAIEDIFCQAGE
jgi:hypothetical protein